MTTVATDGSGRRTRVAAYAWIEHEGSVLLCQNAPHLPNRDMWCLPGGGIDWGEHPEGALHRELHEETGLTGTILDFMGIDSTVRHDPVTDANSPLHAIRLVYRMAATGEPRVIEVDGSTVDAAWHRIDELDRLATVSLVEWAAQRRTLSS